MSLNLSRSLRKLSLSLLLLSIIGGSFAITFAANATMTLKFNGTALYYIVDTNHDHGRFSIQIDETTYPVVSGYAPDRTPCFCLFSATMLDPTMEHTAVLTNLDDKLAMGLDYFMFVPYSRHHLEGLMVH